MLLPSEATLSGEGIAPSAQITSRTGEITLDLYVDELGEVYVDESGDPYVDSLIELPLAAAFDDVAGTTLRAGSLVVTPANDLILTTPASQAGLGAGAATSITG